jgi:predicted phosphodiesterase
MADCRWDPYYPNSRTIHDKISLLIRNANPRFSLYGGDLCYIPEYSYWTDDFFRTDEKELISYVPFINAPGTGSHEAWSQNTKSFTQAFTQAGEQNGYYSFDYGSMHVLVLNQNESFTDQSPQYIFAQNDLQNTNQRWKVVICHEPAYSYGGHGGDLDMQYMTTNIFKPNNVDLVISGHNHYYQHNLVNGIHHLIIGSAGAPLYDPDPVNSSNPKIVKSLKEHNFAVFDVSMCKFKINVYNDNNILIENITLEKSVECKSLSGNPSIRIYTSDGTYLNKLKCGAVWHRINYSNLKLIYNSTQTCLPVNCPVSNTWTIAYNGNSESNGTGNTFSYNFNKTGNYVIKFYNNCCEQQCSNCKIMIKK